MTAIEENSTRTLREHNHHEPSHADVVLVNQILGSQTGGFSGYGENDPSYKETLAPTYLKDHFYDTFCLEPVYYMHIARMLRNAGINTVLMDGLSMGTTWKQLKDKLSEITAPIYCFSIFHSSYFAVIDTIEDVKRREPNAKIILGGTYASIVYKELLNKHGCIDYIVIGDADVSLVELCSCILKKDFDSEVKGIAFVNDAGEVKFEPSKPIEINDLPMPIRDLSEDILESGFSFSMSSSRGCGYGVCSFCYLIPYQKISGMPKFRGRDPELMVEEITKLKEEYGIDHITFVDEDFFGTRLDGMRRAVEFAELLIEKELNITWYANARIQSILQAMHDGHLGVLAKSGLTYCYVGIESGSDKVLKQYKKGINLEGLKKACKDIMSYGIRINPGLITFGPDMDVEIVRANVKMFELVDYYDLFMFTRKLVMLPKTSVVEDSGKSVLPVWGDPSQTTLVVPEEYFKDPLAALLYKTMVTYRNFLYPYYLDFTKSYSSIDDADRKALQASHRQVFDKCSMSIMDGSITNESAMNSQLTTLMVEFRELYASITSKEHYVQQRKQEQTLPSDIKCEIPEPGVLI